MTKGFLLTFNFNVISHVPIKKYNIFASYMKRLPVLLMLLIYMLGISGVSMASHFCCGKLEAINIENAFSFSRVIPKTQSKNCCGKVLHYYQVHDAHQQSVYKNIQVSVSQSPITFLSFKKNFNFLKEAGFSSLKSFHSPPQLSEASRLYIRFSVIRI
jgi:hypothetical protein